MVDVVGFEGIYALTKQGELWSYGNRKGANHKGKFIKCAKDRDGYRRSSLNHPTKGKKYKRIGRLMAETYLGIKEGNYQVNHKNGIRDDDRLENIEWVTPSENIIHSFKILGKSQKGTKNAYFKKWGYENPNGITIVDKTVDDWCLENKIASTTIYSSMREKRKLTKGKFMGFRFFRCRDEFGSTGK